MPEINRYEPRVALIGGRRRARRASASWWPRCPSGTRVALEHAHDQARRDARAAATTPISYPDLAELGPHHRRPRAVTPEDVETFERCIAVGGVALFPADTVYGLATEPDSREGVRPALPAQGAPAGPAGGGHVLPARARRSPRCPSCGDRTRAALERLLPGRASRCCCRTRRAASRSPAGRSPSGSACACRGSRASSRRWRAMRLAGAPVERQPRRRSRTRARVDDVDDERARRRGPRPRRRRAARHALDRRRPHGYEARRLLRGPARGRVPRDRVEAVLRCLR